MQQESANDKKKYEKPEAKRFPLRPDEAVLGFCKTNAASGPSSSGCRGTSRCSVPGS
ncbi:MAG TPA: hypothetical protein VGQ46_05370 [Thermoanaerobaculia bacterium]|nr:hypothetical protein [Thermoanaerobaculia bacterium]